jgi:hypothetical protein
MPCFESKLHDDPAAQIKHILVVKIYWYVFSQMCFTALFFDLRSEN